MGKPRGDPVEPSDCSGAAASTHSAKVAVDTTYRATTNAGPSKPSKAASTRRDLVQQHREIRCFKPFVLTAGLNGQSRSF
jgi:hypothetical protein